MWSIIEQNGFIMLANECIKLEISLECKCRKTKFHFGCTVWYKKQLTFYVCILHGSFLSLFDICYNQFQFKNRYKDYFNQKKDETENCLKKADLHDNNFYKQLFLLLNKKKNVLMLKQDHKTYSKKAHYNALMKHKTNYCQNETCYQKASCHYFCQNCLRLL